MAEPEKKIEIEDVLSSIRRLVAQDPPRSARNEPLKSAAPEPEDALVLTASDRVAESAASEAVTEQDTAEVFDPAGTFAVAEDGAGVDQGAASADEGIPTDDIEPDIGVHDAVDAEDSLDEAWEAVHQSSPARDWPDAEIDTAASDAAAGEESYSALDTATSETTEQHEDGHTLLSSATEDHSTEAFAQEADIPAPAEDVLQLEPHMQTRPAAFHLATGPSSFSPAGDGEFEPEEGDAAPLAGALNAFGHGGEAFGTVPDATEQDTLEEDTAGAEAADPAASATPDPDTAESNTADLQNEDEALTGADAHAFDDPDLASKDWAAEHDEAARESEWHPEEDLPPELETAAETLSKTVAAAAEVEVMREATRRLHLTRPEAEQAAGDAPQRMERQDVSDGAPVFDEEALRQMVGRMIRAELQGALGEQITRKVRRLVRQEINRALISREFE